KRLCRWSVPDANDAAGVGKRKRSQNYGIHHAEDGRIGANSGRQHCDGDQTVTGVLEQSTQAVFKISEQRTHKRVPPLLMLAIYWPPDKALERFRHTVCASFVQPIVRLCNGTVRNRTRGCEPGPANVRRWGVR